MVARAKRYHCRQVPLPSRHIVGTKRRLVDPGLDIGHPCRLRRRHVVSVGEGTDMRVPPPHHHRGMPADGFQGPFFALGTGLHDIVFHFRNREFVAGLVE